MKLNLNTFVKYLKGANFILATFFLVLFSIFAYGITSNNASAYYGTTAPVSSTVNGVTVNVQSLTESFSANATYTAGYRIYSPNNQEITFQIQTQTNYCDTPYGDPNSQWKACADNESLGYQTISLNSGNNYAQDVTLSVTQRDNKPCGSLQTDIWFPENGSWKFILGSLHHTGRAMSECPSASPSPSPSVSPSPSPSPSASPSPSPSVSPSPSPSVSPSPSPSPSVSPSPSPSPSASPSPSVSPSPSASAPVQKQKQKQKQDNNQNQDVHQNVNVTVNNPAPSATTVVYKSVPQVVGQVKGDVRELPKTGLPLAALALGGLLPAGFGIKKFSKKSTGESSANSIWTEKQLNS